MDFPQLVVVALLTALLAATPALAVDEVNTKRLRNGVTVNGILGHERVLQRIANQNGGTRASGTPGYGASVEYVVDRLEAAGYDVTTQDFTFLFFRDLAPHALAGLPDAHGLRDRNLPVLRQRRHHRAAGPDQRHPDPPGPTPSSSNSGCGRATSQLPRPSRRSRSSSAAPACSPTRRPTPRRPATRP